MSRFDSVGIAKQTGTGVGGLGTKQTVPEYYIPVESASPGTNTDEMSREETLGHPFPTDREVGTQHFEPSMSGACRALSLPRLLSAFLGDPVTTSLEAGAAGRHVFDAVANTNPRAVSLLMTRKDPDTAIVDLLWDAVGQELALAVSTNDWFNFDASFVARDIDETLAAPTVTADLTRRFAFYECIAYVSVGGAAEAAVGIDDVTLTYTLDVPTDNNVLGSRRLFKIKPGNRSAEVTFTPKEDLISYYRRAIATSPTNLKLRIEALGPIIAGTTQYRLEIIIHRVFETGAPADISAGDVLQGVEVSAAAAYDSAAGKFVTVTVQNAKASAY